MNSLERAGRLGEGRGAARLGEGRGAGRLREGREAGRLGEGRAHLHPHPPPPFPALKDKAWRMICFCQMTTFLFFCDAFLWGGWRWYQLCRDQSGSNRSKPSSRVASQSPLHWEEAKRTFSPHSNAMFRSLWEVQGLALWWVSDEMGILPLQTCPVWKLEEA